MIALSVTLHRVSVTAPTLACLLVSPLTLLIVGEAQREARLGGKRRWEPSCVLRACECCCGVVYVCLRACVGEEPRVSRRGVACVSPLPLLAVRLQRRGDKPPLLVRCASLSHPRVSLAVMLLTALRCTLLARRGAGPLAAFAPGMRREKGRAHTKGAHNHSSDGECGESTQRPVLTRALLSRTPLRADTHSSSPRSRCGAVSCNAPPAHEPHQHSAPHKQQQAQ